MKKIGKYEIAEELGRGGMGVVYRAYDPSLERDVALKVIQQIALDVADTKARFYREARMAARLSHDAIAVIYEIGEDEGLPFIAMEYLPGADLRAVIDKRESLTIEQKLEYARQICRGLQYAHAKNVIHRDIKPENVKLLDDGRVKIIDFGIAKPYTAASAGGERSTSAVLTQMGMRIGTPWYMSPEQAKGNPVDRRTDIFSFGVVLYELLTYSKPFQGDDTTVLYKILHENPPPIKLHESGLTEELQRILSRCLAKDHEDRYPDCSELLRDLVALSSGPSADPRIRALLSQGMALDKAEAYAEAAAKFNEILEIDPANAQAKAFLKRLSLRDREAFMRRVLAGDIIGTVISHFQILDRIGGGGMGVVYKAEDMSLKRIVALKFLMPDLVRDPSAKKRFLKEAQAASALDHPNICTVHEISETDAGLLFICMAFYGGQNLSARISGGALPAGEALDIVIRIGRGLAKAHENGIVHRDIKPANVIITPDGGVKIVDFGLAKLSGGTQITRVGARMGTLPYMSPEQIRGLELDHRTDIWSLAVLLFQALTGQLPFQREYEAAMLYAIVTDDPPLLGSIHTGLPADLEKVISKGLRKDPNERYASVQTMVDELERIKEEVDQAKEPAVPHAHQAEALLREARDLLKHGRYGESLSRAEQVLRAVPGDARAMEIRDQCKQKLEQAEQVTVLLREGTALFDKGKFAEAREVLEGVLAVDPAQPVATRILEKANDNLERNEQVEKLIAEAEISLKHGKLDAAEAAFRRVMTLDPANKDAQRGLKKTEKSKIARQPAGHITPTPGARPERGRKFLWLIAGAVVLAGAALAVMLLIRKPAAPLAEAPQSTGGPVETAPPVPVPTPEKKADAPEEHPAPGAGGGAAASADPNDIRKLVAGARDEMLAEKTLALKAGGKTLSGTEFTSAQNFEKEGDRRRSSQEIDVIQSARSYFLKARDGYRNVTAEAVRIDGLRKEADGAEAAMSQSRQAVTGSDQEKRSNAKYRSASDAETGARSKYQSGDFAGARDAFGKARALYADAGGEIRTELAAAKSAQPPPEAKAPDKKEPLKDLKQERETGVRQTLESYKKSFEEGDTQTFAALRNLSGDAAKSSDEFFRRTERRSMTIGQIVLQGDLLHARAELVQKFSNKDRGDAEQSLPVEVTLDLVGGRWTISSFSRK